MLKELIIYGNPITRVSRGKCIAAFQSISVDLSLGMPPLLQAKLVQEKGMKIVRHKPHPKDRRFVGTVAKRIMTVG